MADDIKKMVVILDDPGDCLHCPLVNKVVHKFDNAVSTPVFTCGKLHKEIRNPEAKNPDCPLIPKPEQRHTITDSVKLEWYIKGYNACVEALEGKT